ncbi:phytanoyl-CoA dioxygenase family protein [Arcicella lustrica]|uniref:Phytanoyl-CoA dioxygenase family protein n=1 Tax=Arcicella lustrica TaxID=2984196 RepID=A0ABU5SMH4_9BACT|nr:phytanoyl-CoA dioxygenase family protein [Arcicella sp. DC25W]MEA5428453.1 phytanoyl-CoA dioxygenase family protein [Arcicella sp. DC25W]
MIDVENFKKTGYQLIKGLFTVEEIDQIRQDASNIFLNQMRYLNYPIDNINSDEDFNKLLFQLFEEHPNRLIASGKHIQHLISLHRLSLDERIVSNLQKLGLQVPNICTRPVMFFNAKKLAKKQVYWKTDAHQDWRSMQGSLNSMVVWVALADIDTSLGALEVIPESHKLGLQTTEMVDSFGLIPDDLVKGNQFVPVEVRKGDVLFFSSLLIHQSGDNSTENGIRWSCHFRYNDLSENQFIERGYPHPYVYYPNPDLITPDYPQLEDVTNYFQS